MATQIVMNGSGDARYEFSATDNAAIARAERRFQALTGEGFRAVALGKDGTPGQLLREFDPSIEETLFFPQLQGG